MEYSADLKAFNQLFADYQGRFIRFANIYVRDIAVAEDFTIEALMQYWENRNTLKADSNVPAYILTIIKNKYRRNTRYDNQRRGIPYRPGSEKVTCQSERLHTSVGILILYELIRPFRPYTAVWLY